MIVEVIKFCRGGLKYELLLIGQLAEYGICYWSNYAGSKVLSFFQYQLKCLGKFCFGMIEFQVKLKNLRCFLLVVMLLKIKLEVFIAKIWFWVSNLLKGSLIFHPRCYQCKCIPLLIRLVLEIFNQFLQISI